MATVAGVDLEHLRRTLVELGYNEIVTNESAPLVHRILTDLKQATDQYTDLLHHYDDLFARWQQHHNTPSLSNPSLDITHLTGLDSSMLGINQNIDESFMLEAVEQARAQIDSLATEVQSLQTANSKLKVSNDSISLELRNSQAVARELSELIQTKTTLIEGLQEEVKSLRKKTDNSLGLQLNMIIRTAISVLPNELQAAFSAKLCDSADSQIVLLSEVIQRVKREHNTISMALQESRATSEKLHQEHAASEEAMTKMKAGVIQYQMQISDLNGRLNQREFERSLQSDISSQIAALEGVNNMIKEKVSILDRLKQDGVNGNSSEMAQMTVNALLESLSAELNTEVRFTSHLNQLVDKLNNRRLQQDHELTSLNEKIGDLEGKIAKLESEKYELRGHLERATNDLIRKDGTYSNNNEVITNLQQALDSKQSKIEEQKKLKTALEQCQASMANIRRNEEMIRQHVIAQDNEIRGLRSQYEQISLEKTRLTQRVSELESEILLVKGAFRDRTEENQRLSAELKTVLVAKEKAIMDLKTTSDHIVELEEALTAKRREKDMLMTTYCRVIKDNERLHGEFQKLHDEYASSRVGDVQSDSAMKAFQTKVQIQSQELDRLGLQITESEAKVVELEGKLEDVQKSKRRLEDEFKHKEREIKSLKSIISSLEQSKKDLAAQTARFGQQAADLRTHLRRIETEKTELQNKLKSSSLDSPLIRNIQAQLRETMMDLDRTQSHLRLVEREKETLEQQIQFEKIKSSQIEEMMTQERNKRAEQESLLGSVESGRRKLKEQLDMLNKEHDKSLQALKKQIQMLREENERLGWENERLGWENERHPSNNHALPPLQRKSTLPNVKDKGNDKERDREREREKEKENEKAKVTPSPPDSPNGNEKGLATERLKVQNKYLKKHLEDIRKEMKHSLSPDKALEADLESSITAMTTNDDDDEGGGGGGGGESSSPPTSEEIISSNAEMRRRLEHENRLLFKIVDKVKSELLKAGLDTPMSISSSQT